MEDISVEVDVRLDIRMGVQDIDNKGEVGY